jgi:hypothetical protein
MLRKIWTADEIELLKIFAKSGKSKNEYINQFNRNWTAISKQLSKQKISIKSLSLLTVEKHEKEILRLYNKGEGITYLANKYNIHKNNIRRFLKKHVVLRNDHLTHAKKYKYDEHYFDIIDSEDKAYFLGLLFADGHNSANNCIRLSLHKKDIDIIQVFLKKLNANVPIKFTGPDKKMATVNIFSKHMSETLRSYGMSSNKYFSFNFPEILEELNVHFIRGYFDGDGSVFSSKIKTYNLKYTFTITGNYETLLKIQNILCNKLGLKKIKMQKRYKHKLKSSVHFSYTGNRQVKLIRDFLYKDATVYLKRKHSKFFKIP